MGGIDSAAGDRDLITDLSWILLSGLDIGILVNKVWTISLMITDMGIFRIYQAHCYLTSLIRTAAQILLYYKQSTVCLCQASCIAADYYKIPRHFRSTCILIDKQTRVVDVLVN